MADPQEQMNKLISAIEADPQPPHNWLNLGGIFLSNQMWDPMLSMFEQREIMLKDGAVLMFQMLFSETVAKVPQLHNALSKYDGKTLQTNMQLILHYAAGAMKINTGRISEGRKAFKDIAKALENKPKLAEGIPHLKDLGWLADQFKTSDELKETIAASKIKIPDLNWVGEIDTSVQPDKPLIFSCCDVKYFNRFGDMFIKAMSGFGPIHIHVVNGNEKDLIAKRDQFETVEISFSTEDYLGEGGSPYFASVRFLRIKEIMAKFDRDVAMMDIDVEEVKSFDRLLEISSAKDITLFQDKSIIPWLRHWATFIYYKKSNAIHTYQDVMRDALLNTLDGAQWFIDQSLLNCVNQYAEKELNDLKVQYLKSESGFNLFDYIIPSGSLDEKKEIRENANYH